MTEINKESSNKQGYKKTKLGWIPEDWETPEIINVFNFLRTSSFSRNQLNYETENDTYYIHYGDIHATYKTPILDFEKVQTVPKLNDDVVLPATVDYLKDGDVIIADASEDYEGVGTAIELTNINNRKVISGLHTFALRDNSHLTVKGFRTYIFKNPFVKKALKTIATGSKVYGISKSNIQKFKIVLPPLPEQQKIAQILATWDKAIAAQEQLIAEKQALKKGLMQQLLTGKKRFPGFDEEWEDVMLGELFNIRNGKDYKHLGLGNIPVYGTGGIMTYVDDFLFDGESVGIGRKGTIDKPVYLTGKFWTVDTLFYCNSFENCIPKYIYYLFQTINWKKYNEASGVPSLSQTTIKSIKVKMPRVLEQVKILETLSRIDKNLNYLIKKSERLIVQKQGLMQQLLTGEKRVKI
tara:strand:- start:3434 stop:4663 length:1230 start_codon:yes stop_codon:yes gene_type:complete